MLEEIELMGHTAASVICKISKNKKACDISKDIIGVVALLGSVKINELGRSLSTNRILVLMYMKNKRLCISFYVFLDTGFWQSFWVRSKCSELCVNLIKRLIILKHVM